MDRKQTALLLQVLPDLFRDLPKFKNPCFRRRPRPRAHFEISFCTSVNDANGWTADAEAAIEGLPLR